MSRRDKAAPLERGEIPVVRESCRVIAEESGLECQSETLNAPAQSVAPRCRAVEFRYSVGHIARPQKEAWCVAVGGFWGLAPIYAPCEQ